jgi:hypothetical protein
VLLGFLLVALFPLAAFAGQSQAERLVALLNAERADRGLGALQVHPDLVDGAEMQANVIAAAGELSHNQNLGALTEKWKMLGENVAVGYDVDSMHDSWMNSEGHRANILNPDYDFVGVSVVSSDGKLWAAEVFMDANYTGRFLDDDNSVHEDNINWLAASGITMGCTATRFCPEDTVTRGQMAAFIQRALGLPNGSGDTYRDDNNSIFEGAIQALADAGIAEPCASGKYCPDAAMTREMMAVFLERALNLPASNNDRFTDDNNSKFEAEIQALAAAGVTVGCSDTKYCPNNSVTREQMASFLQRAFG